MTGRQPNEQKQKWQSASVAQSSRDPCSAVCLNCATAILGCACTAARPASELHAHCLMPARRHTLYILDSFSFRSFFDTPASPGWMTSHTNCLRCSRRFVTNFFVLIVTAESAM